jgi:outer membrane biogenesis lipoprotein LolB
MKCKLKVISCAFPAGNNVVNARIPFIRIRFVTLLIWVVLAAGCAHIPFQETRRISVESDDPKSVVAQFKANSPDNFQLLNSVVFEYSWQSFMGIGYVDVNRQNSTFKLVCLNPLGVQLFELSGDRDTIVPHHVMPALTEFGGDLPTAVGTDIRRIYFDLVPSDKARIAKSTYEIKFSEPYGAGVMEYEFAGEERELVGKSYYENDDIIWRISYYEYREQNGKHFPQGIIMKNYKYGYQLTVRQKELYS